MAIRDASKYGFNAEGRGEEGKGAWAEQDWTLPVKRPCLSSSTNAIVASRLTVRRYLRAEKGQAT